MIAFVAYNPSLAASPWAAGRENPSADSPQKQHAKRYKFIVLLKISVPERKSGSRLTGKHDFEGQDTQNESCFRRTK